MPIITELLIASAAVRAASCFGSALYASTWQCATIGHGDLVRLEARRAPSAIEDADGMILLGWRTAFFVAIVTRLPMPGSRLAAEAA